MRRAVLVVLALATAACAPRRPPALPTGSSTPFPEFAAAYAQATAACVNVKTFTAVLAMSGRAGRTKLRGRLEAGFSAPASMRLEGVAPFGRPMFVLTASNENGTLVLTRDNRVLRDAPAASIVDALVGVPLGAAAMRTIVDGCGVAEGAAPVSGQRYSNGWAAITFADHVTYLQRTGEAWQVSATTRGALSVFYADFDQQRPGSVRLRVEDHGDVTADITLRVSQADANTALDASAFAADIPSDAEPLTLDELRRAGPLGDGGELPATSDGPAADGWRLKGEDWRLEGGSCPPAAGGWPRRVGSWPVAAGGWNLEPGSWKREAGR